MNCVLNSFLAIKWVLAEPESDEALKVRGAFNNQIHKLLVPDVFPVEVAHALAKAERRGVIRQLEGTLKLADISDNLPDLHSYLPSLPRAFALASQSRIGVYNCLYVALTEREGYEHLTTDDRLVRTLQPTYPFITPGVGASSRT